MFGKKVHIGGLNNLNIYFRKDEFILMIAALMRVQKVPVISEDKTYMTWDCHQWAYHIDDKCETDRLYFQLMIPIVHPFDLSPQNIFTMERKDEKDRPMKGYFDIENATLQIVRKKYNRKGIMETNVRETLEFDHTVIRRLNMYYHKTDSYHLSYSNFLEKIEKDVLRKNFHKWLSYYMRKSPLEEDKWTFGINREEVKEWCCE